MLAYSFPMYCVSYGVFKILERLIDALTLFSFFIYTQYAHIKIISIHMIQAAI